MSILDDLIRQGRASFPGMQAPRAPGNFQDVLASTLSESLDFQKQEQKRQEEMVRKAEMYKTLRQAGYSSDEAYKSVEEGKLIPGAGKQKTVEELKDEIDLQKTAVDIEKSKADISKIKAETEKISNPEETFSGAFRRGMSDVRSGKRTLREVSADLYERYPEKNRAIKVALGKADKRRVNFTGKMDFRKTSNFNPNFDYEKTVKAGNKIKTASDLEELKQMRAEYEDAGVDVDYILKLYGR